MNARMHRNQSGMSLVTVMIVMAIVGLSAVSILSISNQKRKLLQQMNVAVSANMVKQKLVGLVLSPQSWQATQSHNTAVFAMGSSFCTSPCPELKIYLPDAATVFYDPTDASAGFNLKGNPCSGFSTSGNDECPLRYSITLKKHEFINSNWIDTLQFTLSFKPASSGLILNTTNKQFTFELVRNISEESVESACISLNGVYHADANSCSEKITTSVAVCGGGETYRGPASNAGSTNCDPRTVAALSCPSGNYIRGFELNGNPLCGSMP